MGRGEAEILALTEQLYWHDVEFQLSPNIETCGFFRFSQLEHFITDHQMVQIRNVCFPILDFTLIVAYKCLFQDALFQKGKNTRSIR